MMYFVYYTGKKMSIESNSRKNKQIFNLILKTHSIDVKDFLKSEYNYEHRICLCCCKEVPYFNHYGRNKDTFNLENDGEITLRLNYDSCCRLPECESKKWNPMSRDFLIRVKNLSDNQADEIIESKNKKTMSRLIERGFFEDKSNNPFSKDYWIKQGLSDDEVELKFKNKSDKMISTKRENGFFEDKSNNPFSKDYWVKRGLSDNEINCKIRNRNWVCEEFYESNKNKHLYDYSLRGRVKSKEFYIAKGFSEYESIKIISEINEKTKQTRKLTLNYVVPNYASKEANIFFIKLYKRIRKKYGDIIKREDIYFNLNKRGEYFIKSPNDRIYFYDFVIPKMKICIEYNGSHVHPNEKWDDVKKSSWKHAYSKKNYDQCIEEEYTKYSKIESLGFKVLKIFDSDENKMEIINQFLKENFYGNS